MRISVRERTPRRERGSRSDAGVPALTLSSRFALVLPARPRRDRLAVEFIRKHAGITEIDTVDLEDAALEVLRNVHRELEQRRESTSGRHHRKRDREPATRGARRALLPPRSEVRQGEGDRDRRLDTLWRSAPAAGGRERLDVWRRPTSRPRLAAATRSSTTRRVRAEGCGRRGAPRAGKATRHRNPQRDHDRALQKRVVDFLTGPPRCHLDAGAVAVRLSSSALNRAS